MKNRIPWLCVLMISGTLSAFVIGMYQSLLDSVVMLSSFMTIITGTGGNAGSQASAMVIRGLALGDIQMRDTFKVVFKELRVGILCGLILAMVNMIRMTFFDHSTPFNIDLTVSLSMGVAVVLAKTLGCILPILAKAVKLDPAMMAGPFDFYGCGCDCTGGLFQHCNGVGAVRRRKKIKRIKTIKTVSQACYVIPFFCADNSALLRDTISKIGKGDGSLEWNLLTWAQLLFFGLGAWYFWRSSRRKGAGEGLRCEDNIVEMDKLMAMEEIKLTEPLAEQTRPRTLEEIIGQENGIKALRAALCGPNPQHILIYGPPGVGKTAAARLNSGGSEKKKGLSF